MRSTGPTRKVPLPVRSFRPSAASEAARRYADDIGMPVKRAISAVARSSPPPSVLRKAVIRPVSERPVGERPATSSFSDTAGSSPGGPVRAGDLRARPWRDLMSSMGGGRLAIARALPRHPHTKGARPGHGVTTHDSAGQQRQAQAAAPTRLPLGGRFAEIAPRRSPPDPYRFLDVVGTTLAPVPPPGTEIGHRRGSSPILGPAAFNPTRRPSRAVCRQSPPAPLPRAPDVRLPGRPSPTESWLHREGGRQPTHASVREPGKQHRQVELNSDSRFVLDRHSRHARLALVE